jgi:hypothetical protein
MEAYLKKTKITKSVVKQLEISTHTDLEEEIDDVLGWCICDGLKYIIICSKNGMQHRLIKLPYIIKITSESQYKDNFGDELHVIKLDFGLKLKPLLCVYSDKQYADKFHKHITRIKNRADVKGQFFL